MGRAARPLHDPGNHRAIERGSNLQAARRGGLIKPAKPAEERENTAALTPSLGARPCWRSEHRPAGSTAWPNSRFLTRARAREGRPLNKFNAYGSDRSAFSGGKIES